MSDFIMEVSLPLDDDGFFRRCCPLCNREFKVLLEKGELGNLVQLSMDSYLIETNLTDENNTQLDDSGNGHDEEEFTCPYCKQSSPKSNWWTQEQRTYIMVFAQNIIAKTINEHLVKPLKQHSRRSNSGFISISFEAKEMELVEPWISPEENDMEIAPTPRALLRL